MTPYGSSFDDVLYVRIATFLAHGQWLGPFDQLTLLKGPAYPAFIALTYRSGVPLKIGEQLTYLLSAAAVAGCVWMTMRRRAAALVVYVVLALDPVNFDSYNARVLRDGWYASLSVLFVATFFLAAFGAITHVRLRWLIPVSVTAGLGGAAFWLCREEGVWIVPSILLIAFGLPSCLLVRWWCSRPRTRPTGSRALLLGGRLGLVLAIVGVALVTPIVAVTAGNSSHYGAGLTNDLVSGQFARAYADWRRVQAGSPTAATPLVRAQREAVYQISSAARQLEPFLEDPGSPGMRASCRILAPCGELAGVVVVFALRDAAANAGHFRSEADVQTFFGELDAQIDAGCTSGQLSCTARLPTEIQSIQHLSAGAFSTYLWHLGGMTLASTGFDDPPNTLDPLGSGKSRVLFTQIIRGMPPSERAAGDQMSHFTANAWPYRLVSDLYRVLLPVLLMIALVGLVLSIARPRWPQVALSVLTCALVVGALSRLVLVAFLDTTLFPTAWADIRYLLPAHAFLMAFGAMGSAQFVDVVRARLQPSRNLG